MIPVILDCDNTMGLHGKDVDDGLAILYLLGSKNINLLGITTTYGNSTIEDVHKNTLEMVDELKLSNLPVFKGAASKEDRHSEAAEALVKFVNESPNQITILGTGSLTNLLGAYMIDNDFFKKVKNIVLMGGIEKPLMINDKIMNELNFACDPEATHSVLTSGADVSIITGHLCLQAVFSYSTYDLMIGEDNQKIFNYIERKTRPWIDFIGSIYKMDGFHNWDAVAALFVDHPEEFETETCFINSSVNDLKTGMLIHSKENKGYPIKLPRNIINIDRFNKTLIDAWAKVDYPE